MENLEKVEELVKEAILLVQGNPYELYLRRHLIEVECEVRRQLALLRSKL